LNLCIQSLVVKTQSLCALAPLRFNIPFKSIILKNFILTLSPILLAACAAPETPAPPSPVNTAHLERLYEEIDVDGPDLGAVWIYCEAPDYRLVEDADEGFTCVDDVSRALVFYCREYKKAPSPEAMKKIKAMTEFLLYMRAENGFFYNFLLPGPEINKTHQNSRAVPGWWSWRAFWALSELNLIRDINLGQLQNRTLPVMDTLVQRMKGLCDPAGGAVDFDGIAVPSCLANLGADQVGVMMIGLANYYRLDPPNAEDIKDLLLSFGNLLLEVQHGGKDAWPYGAIMSWRNQWHAWGNSQAYALIYAGWLLEHQPFIEAGLKEVKYFYPYCLEKGFISGFSVAKEADSLVMKDYRQFPQIAYGIRPMVFASMEAYAITGDTTYANTARRLASWLSGNNPAGLPMYDPATGRTFDGIGSPTEVNKNSGAESTIEALLTLQKLNPEH